MKQDVASPTAPLSTRVPLVVLIVLASLLSLRQVAPARAQTQTPPFDLVVSPPVTYLQVEPGSSVTHTVIMEQKGGVPIKVTPQIVDFIPNPVTGQPQLQPATSFPFIKLTGPIDDTQTQTATPSFSLLPGQKKNITFAIDVPQATIEKEYPLTLLFNADAGNEFAIGDTGSEVSGSIASNLIVFVSRLANSHRSKIEVERLQAPWLIDSLQALTFDLHLKNTGLQAGPASGSATITNWQGQTVATFELYPDMVLAQHSRPARAIAKTVNSDNKVLVDPTHFVYNQPFLIGIYSINVILNSEANNQQKVLNSPAKTIKVIAAPISLIVLAVLIPILYLVSRLLNKNYFLSKPEKKTKLNDA